MSLPAASAQTSLRRGIKPQVRITLDYVWAGFAELQKAHAETEAAIKETQAALIVLLLKKYKKGEVSPSATALRASAYPLYGVLTAPVTPPAFIPVAILKVEAL